MKERLPGLAAELRQCGMEPTCDESLDRHTSYRIGGPADLWVEISGQGQLILTVQAAKKRHIPVHILGGGTNVLVSDRGMRGLVIGNWMPFEGGPPRELSPSPGSTGGTASFEIGSGVSLSRTARWAAESGLSGLEWAEGIPGTIGGAIIGNAGAFGSDMASIVGSVLVLNETDVQQQLDRSDVGFGYRTSHWKRSATRPILLACQLSLTMGSREEIKARSESFRARRRQSQPQEPSAGSVFRNPAAAPAGQLIEEAGLKGLRCGGAVVSKKHANFIVNQGKASSNDVWSLIEQVREQVFSFHGVELALEIERVGEWD